MSLCTLGRISTRDGRLLQTSWSLLFTHALSPRHTDQTLPGPEDVLQTAAWLNLNMCHQTWVLKQSFILFHELSTKLQTDQPVLEKHLENLELFDPRHMSKLWGTSVLFLHFMSYIYRCLNDPEGIRAGRWARPQALTCSEQPQKRWEKK